MSTPTAPHTTRADLDADEGTADAETDVEPGAVDPGQVEGGAAADDTAGEDEPLVEGDVNADSGMEGVAGDDAGEEAGDDAGIADVSDLVVMIDESVGTFGTPAA